MDSFLPIRSSHLFELLRFAEHRHRVNIQYGAAATPTSMSIVIHPFSVVESGEPIEINEEGGPQLLVGRHDGCELHIPLDLDGMLLKSAQLPDEVSDLAPPAFVGRVLDACVAAAAESYRSQVLERKRRDYVRYRSRATRERIAGLQSTQRNLSEQISRLDRDLQDAWRRKNDVDMRLRVHEEVTVPETRRQAEGEFDRVWGLVPARFEKVELFDWAVIATTTPITIEHDGVGYEMGRFKITVPFNQSEHLIAVSVDQPAEHTDYAHPHIGSDGVPCWGNLSGSASECRTSGDVFHQLVLTDRLLRSYNPSSPYAEIERWDPDWMDEDRYERCIEDAVPYSDCIDCSDDCCPYWASRHERCWENIYEDDLEALDRCTSCATCDHHNQAVDLVSEILEELDE